MTESKYVLSEEEEREQKTFEWTAEFDFPDALTSCPMCSFESDSLPEYRTHRNTAHQTITCSKCLTQTNSERLFELHKTFCERPRFYYACICGPYKKIFKTQSAYENFHAKVYGVKCFIDGRVFRNYCCRRGRPKARRPEGDQHNEGTKAEGKAT